MTKYCDLHVHLEGCIWPNHYKKWWKNSSYLFSPPNYYLKDDFERFLSYIRFGYNFLNSVDSYCDVIMNYLQMAQSTNIVYTEMIINIAVIQSWQLNILEILDTANKYIINNKHCPRISYIIDLPWQFPASSIDDTLKYSDDLKLLRVVGFSLGGDERYADINEANKYIKKIRSLGFKTLCHLGEVGSKEYALELLKTVKPDRIAHAVLISDEILALGTKSPPIDVCLTSNIALNIINSYSQHPFMKWLESGVCLTLGTDDPAIFNTSIEQEHKIAELNYNTYSIYKKSIREFYLRASFNPKAVAEALELA